MATKIIITVIVGINVLICAGLVVWRLWRGRCGVAPDGNLHVPISFMIKRVPAEDMDDLRVQVNMLTADRERLIEERDGLRTRVAEMEREAAD